MLLSLISISFQGDYDHSFAVLHEAQEKFPRTEATAWMAGFQEVLFIYSANESKYNDAMKAISLLAPIRPWESILR